MPALSELSRNQVDDPIVLYAFERRFGQRDPASEPGRASGSSFGSFETVLAHSPECLEHVLVGMELSDRAGLDGIGEELRALLMARIGGLMGSRHIVARARREMLDQGMAPEQSDAVMSWSCSDRFDTFERAALAYADAIVLGKGRVPDGQFEALRAMCTDKAILSLSYFIGSQMVLCRMCRSLRLEEDALEVPPVEAAAAAPPLSVPTR